jgi:hypothetical protein
MPLWPVDFKVGLYFAASHVVPVSMLLFPQIERKLELLGGAIATR